MRYLCAVILQMLQEIPESEEALIAALKKKIDEERYRAPEINDWRGTALILQCHLDNHLRESWAQTVLKIWRDEP